MAYIEQLLKEKTGRLLIVETSSDHAQIGARKFYQKIGYKQVAVIEDFWKDGEDKIVFFETPLNKLVSVSLQLSNTTVCFYLLVWVPPKKIENHLYFCQTPPI